MASSAAAAAATPSHPLLHPSSTIKHGSSLKPKRVRATATTVTCMATDNSGRRKGTPGVDTRIHWDNPDEGWIGVKSTSDQTDAANSNNQFKKGKKKKNLGQSFGNLIDASAGTSHYQFLGVGAEAEVEEIKAAYRRLSKEYHPDTTSLPLTTASRKFMQLREAYAVLSKEESRRFYDWTLVQEAESKRAERMRSNLEDPYERDVREWESVPDMVDRLGGKNLKLSDQAMTALGIDAIILLFSICSIVYALFFKEY